MPAERNYYVICDDNCRFPSMTKEQILAAIEEATGYIPSDVDDGFITTIKEQNRNKGLKFWVGTLAEYNALQTKPADCFCIITDDTTVDDLTRAVEQMQTTVEQFTDKIGKTLWEGAQCGLPDEGFTVDINGIQNYRVLLFDIATSYEDPCDHFTAIATRTGNMVYVSRWDNKRTWASEPSKQYFLQANIGTNKLFVYDLVCTENGTFKSNPYLRAVYGIA